MNIYGTAKTELPESRNLHIPFSEMRQVAPHQIASDPLPEFRVLCIEDTVLYHTGPPKKTHKVELASIRAGFAGWHLNVTSISAVLACTLSLLSLTPPTHSSEKNVDQS